MKNATLYDYARMCRESGECTFCPLSISNNNLHYSCKDMTILHTDKANEIILNWCKEHPVETRQDRFLKMFPNAEINKDGVIKILPCDIEKGAYISDCYSCSAEHGFSGCDECRKNYWLAEVK